MTDDDISAAWSDEDYKHSISLVSLKMMLLSKVHILCTSFTSAYAVRW